MIFIYRFLTFFLFPVFIIIIYLRTFLNKEDKIRYKEKLFINEKSLEINKKVYWIHAASIGEINSVLPLIKEFIKNDKKIFILLTSTTLSSSKLIKRIKLDPRNFQHRFFPLDTQFLVKKFLNYLKPKTVIFIDSEVWPNYLLELSQRKIPIILLNGRITEKTYRRWRILPALSEKIFKLYDLCLSSSQESENNLKLLGAKNVKYIGNLKFCFNQDNKKDHENLRLLFNNHFVWCAASTHPDEEEIILKTHNLLKKKGVNVVTIIIPRHITRSKKIFEICKNSKLNSQIINNFKEISKESDILIINSIGEMTKYFYNCKSIFMGKSFSEKLSKVGGQNPIEPAKCGCKIYFGPYVSNFREIYNLLNKKEIAYEVRNEIELSDNLFKDFNSKNDLDKKNIIDLNSYGEKILLQTTKEILKF